MCAVRRCDGLSSGIFAVLLVHISLHSNSQAAEGAGKGASEHGQHAFQAGQLGNGLDLVGVHHVAVHSTGLQGELLALTPADFDFEKGTVKISKTYQRLKGQDVITSPKTKKSNRTVQMPDFLCTEMQEFFGMQYGLKKKDRVFTVTKSYLHHEMNRGAEEAGVKRIRIHDLRHSHISLLIDMGFSAVAIADRVGHESIEITYRYAHLFPSKQKEMAAKLDFMNKGV